MCVRYKPVDKKDAWRGGGQGQARDEGLEGGKGGGGKCVEEDSQIGDAGV